MAAPLLNCNDSGVPHECAAFSVLSDGRACHETGWQDCGCLAISASQNVTIDRIDTWEREQAFWQWLLSFLSLVFGGAYMLLYLRAPKEMWRYPQNLAFWICAPPAPRVNSGHAQRRLARCRARR